ncbi:HAMP domain-containing histidine kinase [Fusibacter paucivorans]|uniref:histidine kinase n=1 Tax=Fusibacter paucivorans TaxID=76009 RepID=A0ABS5PT03_9FIRM|nr:HAMP domain-containing sensor histidine kinase [Fusibacter paucivorans]MBS7528305.1 HAMP domain-containing histidine kinase [Fusibacter paucivorans]
MKMAKAGILTVATIMMCLSFYFVFDRFSEKEIQSENGILEIHNDIEEDVINVSGKFMIVDGIRSPEAMNAYAGNADDHASGVKWLTYNDIRQYHYPEDAITAYIKIEGDLSGVSGLLIEEIYSAAALFINGKSVASLGNIASDGTAIMAKESRLIRLEQFNGLEPLDSLILIMQISNPEHIGGQLQKFLFIGDYDALFKLWNNRIVLKSIHSVFYCTMGLVLLGLFIRNQKHLFLLTLGIAGILNSYIIITYFEPFINFTPQGNAYIVNSYLQAFPTLITQYLSALSIILYLKKGKVYRHFKRFVPVTLAALILSIAFVILAEQAADLFYIVLLFAVMLLMLYALTLLGKTYLQDEKRGPYLYIAFLTYILSYGLLIGISLSNHSFGLLSQYQILLMTGQFAFYLLMSYFIITDFSRRFYLTEVNENYLEKVVFEKTMQLQDSLKSLEKEDVLRRQLLSDISHDLRSPITVIKGYIELISTGKIEEERKAHYIDIVLKKVNYVSDLVENILYLARIEQGKATKKDIESLDLILNEVIDTYQYQSHHFNCTIPENIQFECDYGQIKRLFVNLIDNAIDYSSDGSTVYIHLKEELTNYRIEIRDEGIGIEADKIDQIFNRFVRADVTRNNETNHFGLGLAIVKSIVTSHGGIIQCESQVGEGTMFTILFPMKGGGK